MNLRTTDFASARNLLCLAASIFGLMVLAFAVAPGTVLASTAGVYEEQELPPKPKPKDNGNDKKNGSGGDKAGNGHSSGTGSGDSDSGSGSSGGDGGTGSGQKSEKYSNGQYDPATDSKKSKAGKEDQADDDSTVAAAPTSGGGDDGGSAWPLIIAIVIGVPLLGAGGYFFWKRFHGPDEQTREKLKSVVGGKSAGESAGKSGS